MKPFSACVLSVIIPLVCSSTVSLSSLAKWKQYKSQHGKIHSVEEDSLRLARFLESEAEIRQHNQRFERGEESYALQHNHFSDMSDEEVFRNSFGFLAVGNTSLITSAPDMPTDIPANFDWRDRNAVTPARQQGECNSCYAFAAATVVEGYLATKKGIHMDVSEQEVVDCSREKYIDPIADLMNHGCLGGWPTPSLQYFKEFDVEHEANYPYFSGRTSDSGWCKRKPRTPVLGNINVHHVRPRDEKHMAEILYTKGPLVIAFAGDGEHKKHIIQYKEGIFDRENTSHLEPNHAVALVGYGTENGKDYWVIKNSWGPEWGLNGFGKLARGKNLCNLMKYGVWYID